MTSYLHPASLSGRFHVCDQCNQDDGRKVIVWKEKDFALCLECLDQTFIKFAAPGVKAGETLEITRTTISEEVRNRVFDRDGGACLKCGSTNNLALDHIIPFSRGGKTEEENLQTLCRSCNSIKGARLWLGPGK